MTVLQTVTLVITLGLILTLAVTRFKPFHVFLVGVLSLLFTGVLTIEEATMGFSNRGVITLFLVLAFSQVFRGSALLHRLLGRLFHEGVSYAGFVVRSGMVLAPISAVMSNTLLMAVTLPYIVEWSRRKGLVPSRVLLPLASLIIAGGTLTLIGTSSHLVIAGFARTQDPPVEIPVFALLPVGVVVLVVVVVYWLVMGWRLLPVRRDPRETVEGNFRQYTAEARVLPDSPLVGQTVARARLRHLRRLFLVEILRGDERIYPVKPADVIQAGDILVFVGTPEAILELTQVHPGLEIGGLFARRRFPSMDVVEAVIPLNSTLARRRLRDTQFRARFDAAVIAIHRHGEPLRGGLGNIVLQSGDLLLLLTGPDFWARVRNETDLYVIGKVGQLYRLKGVQDWFLYGVFLVAIGLSALGVVSLPVALAGALALLTVFRILSLNDLRTGIDWPLVLVTALSIPIGYAFVKVGLVDRWVSWLANTVSLTPWWWLVIVYGLGMVLTELTFNVGAAALMAPIAIQVARVCGSAPEPFLLSAMFSVALSFLTPYGYQVNLMVMGPGGYRFVDYLRAGFPLTVIFLFLIPTLLYVLYWKGA